jgi:hypothetical protein
MWQIVHTGTLAVVGIADTRAEAYSMRYALRGISDERFRVEHV